MKRSLAGLLVAALLVVQMLGLVHRIAHGGHGQPVSARLVEGRQPHAVQSPQAQGFLAALFAGHAGQRDCDAFDQMSQAYVAASSLFALAADPPAAMTVIFHRAWHIAAQARGFLARGPPTVA